ncbi:MAG: hypothetical protein MJA27_28125 [Pseudanabaenales cyanobacterium]|nr:hypothetical protein [Pseudanabaenales cyanobacterium]
MGIVRMGPPTELITKIASEFKVQNFVETGTYYGNTAFWASQEFPRVFTIEYSRELYEKVIQEYSYAKNIEFIFGDSRVVLDELVSSLEGSTLFWLDAHWSGGSTYGNTDQCPLVEELKVINNSQFENFILIDDARLFTSPPQPPHKVEQWPDIVTVINTLLSAKHNRYVVIIEDVIISAPTFAKQVVVQHCQAVNAKAWEEYGRQIKTSDFKKGMSLIFQDLRRKVKSSVKRLKSSF